MVKRLVFCAIAASAMMLTLATSPAMHPFIPQTPAYQVIEVTPIATSPAMRPAIPQTRAARVGPRLVHGNRRLLYTVMVEAGFTNYPLEWWHYDYGDQFWGHLSKRDAIYGLAEKLR